jgi:hypothetical protein
MIGRAFLIGFLFITPSLAYGAVDKWIVPWTEEWNGTEWVYTAPRYYLLERHYVPQKDKPGIVYFEVRSVSVQEYIREYVFRPPPPPTRVERIKKWCEDFKDNVKQFVREKECE